MVKRVAIAAVGPYSTEMLGQLMMDTNIIWKKVASGEATVFIEVSNKIANFNDLISLPFEAITVWRPAFQPLGCMKALFLAKKAG